MISPVTIGTLGVGLLLLAFVLNLLGRLSENSATYLLLNILGASLAAYYALDGGMIPFVVLEAVWAATALVRLAGLLFRRRQA